MSSSDSAGDDNAGDGPRMVWVPTYDPFSGDIDGAEEVPAEHPATPAEVECACPPPYADCTHPPAEPDAGVTSVEPGCTCGGMAACEQCQTRDAGDANGLTEAERNDIQDSSGAPGRLGRKHFEAVERIVATRVREAEQRGAEKAWDEGKAAGLREGKVVSPFHDRFRSVNPYRATPDPNAARLAALKAEHATATPERQAEILAERDALLGGNA